MTATEPTLVLGMATYRRPDDVRRILPLLLAQTDSLTGATARVVVVDNDPAASARDVVDSFIAAHSAALSYEHEPRPGIAAARNRAMDAAAGDDLLVFIDDDESPHDGWLQHLFTTWRTYRSAAVAGPVPAHPETPLDEWLVASGVFVPRNLPTGTLTKGFGTGNLLLDLNQLRAADLRFDDAYGLSGGSDTKLAHSMRKAGLQIRWCNEAVADEFIPTNRLTHKWAFQRTLRTSNTWSRVHIDLAQGKPATARWMLELTARGVLRAARGGVRWGLGTARRSVADQARGAIDVASGAGLILGVFGGVRVEYARKGA